MMRTLGAMTLAAALAGCATVGQTMSEKSPSLELMSSKSPTAFRDCMVGSAISAAYMVTERDGGFMFVATQAPGQIILATPEGAGSKITVWGLLGTRRGARACS